MARPGVTPQQVFAAANQIAARGEQPTVEHTRHELGDTGSHSTVLRFLREWRETQRTATNRALTDIPEPLTKTIDAAMREVWASASKIASQEIESIRRDAQQRVAVLEDQLNDALSTLESVETQRDRAEDELKKAQDRVHALEQQAAARETELTLLHQQLHAKTDEDTLSLRRLESLFSTLAQPSPDAPRKKAGADKIPTSPAEPSTP